MKTKFHDYVYNNLRTSLGMISLWTWKVCKSISSASAARKETKRRRITGKIRKQVTSCQNHAGDAPSDLNSPFSPSRPAENIALRNCIHISALIISNQESAGLQIACGKFLFARLLCMPHPIQTFGGGHLYCMRNFYKEALTFPIPPFAVVPADMLNSPRGFWPDLASGSSVYMHYTTFDVLPLERKCSDSYWDLLMEHRQ